MRGLPRLVLLAAVFGLFLWFLLRLSPDRPATVQAPSAAGSDEPSGGTPQTQAWTQEDRVIWRETMDRRLGR